MSFAKHFAKKVAANGKLDLYDLIEEACAKKSTFSLGALKLKMRLLNNYLQGCSNDDIDMDKFMLLFFEMYEVLYGNKERKTGVFHPSSITAECPRKMYYEFTNVAESDAVENKIDGKLQRIFDVGTWYHTYFQMLLWKAGVLKKSEVNVVSVRKRIYGHCDGILDLSKVGIFDDVLLEIKTMNSFSYAKGKMKVFKKHEQQAGIYAKTSGIKKICYLYINKDTSEYVTHIKGIDDELVGEVETVMNVVLSAVRESDTPERICASLKSAPAKSCPYATHCFKLNGRKHN